MPHHGYYIHYDMSALHIKLISTVSLPVGEWGPF